MAAPTSFLVFLLISLALTNSLARPLDHVDGGYTPGEEEQVSKLGRGGLGRFGGGWLRWGGRGAFGSLPYGGYGWQGGPYGPGWPNSPYAGYPYPYPYTYPYPYPGDVPPGGDPTWPFTSTSQGLSATNLGSDVDCKSGAGEFHPYCNPGFSMSSEPKKQNHHGTSKESDVAKHSVDGRSMVKNHDGDDEDDDNNY